MGIEDESQRIPPTPETTVEKQPVEQTVEDSAEAPEKTAEEVMIDFLADKNFLTREESVLVSSEKVDELIVRTAHEYEHAPDEIPQQHIDKARRILGLQPNLGEGHSCLVNNPTT